MAKKNEEDILKRILEEEKVIAREEKLIEEEEASIKAETENMRKEQKELEELVKQKVISRKFVDIIEWKTAIWNECPYKKKDEEEKEITFTCEKLKNTCSFTRCPENIY